MSSAEGRGREGEGGKEREGERGKEREGKRGREGEGGWNQSPKGNMWSAIPVALLCMLVIEGDG